VFNQASLLNDFLSPGEIVTITLANLGPASAVAATPGTGGRFPTTLAGMQVLFDGWMLEEACLGTLITGGVGSGKTTGPFQYIVGTPCDRPVFFLVA
jgi:uncharacterized protein (TIGR03437 family)